MKRARLAIAVVALLGVEARARAAAISIDVADGAGEGFNDPTAFSPGGGNTATTLGGARLVVFQTAAAIWGARLASPVPIHVSAVFDPLPCTSTQATLGAAGAETVHQNFPSAPRADTWYPQALANALARQDLDPTSPDITAEFNSTLDTGTCLGGATWYYGLDAHPPAGKLDLLTVLLHELAHGLGFMTWVDPSTGERLLGADDVFSASLARYGATPTRFTDMTDAQRASAATSDPNLVWLGPIVDAAGATTLTAGLTSGDVRLHAPATLTPGSSVSHYSTALTPNELMEPFYTGPDHDVTLTLDLLRDVGWSSTPPVVPATPPWTSAAFALALFACGARSRRAGQRAAVVRDA
ncbi:MAG TPA: hypothetical protein VHJ20_05010 [Polyangia bacterium]|nr:hypothetical protein [Polyangia bacterium]